MSIARRLKIVSGLAAVVVIVLVAGSATSALRGCTQYHYRPHGHQDVTFDVSPDAHQVVFNGVGDGGRDLYLLDLNTFRVRRLAATVEYEVDPAFSPDGKLIVFAAGVPGDRADHIFIRDTENPAAAKHVTAGQFSDASPSFSPDGGMVVFARAHNYLFGGLRHGVWENWRVYTVDLDGKDVRLQNDDSDAFGFPLRQLAYGEFARSLPDDTVAPARQSVREMLNRSPQVYHKDWRHPVMLADQSAVVFLVEVWPNGPTGVPKCELWQVAVEGGVPRRLASSRLFDDPLNWRKD